MMRSKAICLLGLALLGPCITGYAERLTFPQALEKMKERNEALTATQDDVEMRGLEQAAARGLRYPRVELEARHLMLNDPIRISVDPVPVSLTVQDDQFNQGQLKASLPLYTGGRIEAAVRASEARVNEAQAEGRKTEEALTTELAERYFGCCLVESNLEVQAFKTRTMEEHAYQARRLLEEGIIARVEYLNAKVALANARAEQSAAERDAAIAAEGLSNALADPSPGYPATPLFIVRDLEDAEPVLRTFSGWKRSLKETRDYDELPLEAKDYISFIEEYTETAIDIVSVGYDRKETIVRKSPWIRY